MQVRPATRADVDAVLELWAQARSDAASTPDDVEAIARLLEDGGGALIVAKADGRVVGAIVAGWDGWRGNMYRLAVLPAYRRRGIGRRLVEAGHDSLRAKGARRVTALIAHAEEEAIALWRAAGYELDEDMSRLVRNL
jgi:ribosomal protein S18 acetylase RimI-like enzyme